MSISYISNVRNDYPREVNSQRKSVSLKQFSNFHETLKGTTIFLIKVDLANQGINVKAKCGIFTV